MPTRLPHSRPFHPMPTSTTHCGANRPQPSRPIPSRLPATDLLSRAPRPRSPTPSDCSRRVIPSLVASSHGDCPSKSHPRLPTPRQPASFPPDHAFHAASFLTQTSRSRSNPVWTFRLASRSRLFAGQPSPTTHTSPFHPASWRRLLSHRAPTHLGPPIQIDLPFPHIPRLSRLTCLGRPRLAQPFLARPTSQFLVRSALAIPTSRVRS